MSNSRQKLIPPTELSGGTTLVAATLSHLSASDKTNQRERSETSVAARRLRHLSEIGLALSAQRDIRLLLSMILTAARDLTVSDGGSLYIVEENEEGGKNLFFRAAQNDSIVVDTNMSFVVGANSLAGYAALTGEILRFDDVYDLPPEVPFQFNPRFDVEHNYRTKSVLVVPLQNHVGETIGVLQLINRKQHREVKLSSPAIVESEVVGFDEEMTELAATLASQAAVALNNNLLLQEIEALFESLVVAASSAIESRDPSTSGHSRRVTNLTLELAKAINEVESGPLADVTFSPIELRELRYACLLHDFGKIGVREAILTKSNKIAPIEFTEFKMRVLALQRQWEADCARQQLDLWHSGAPDASASDEIYRIALEERIARLRGDFSAICAINDPMQEPYKDEVWAAARAGIGRFAEMNYLDADGQLRPLLSEDEAAALRVARGTLTPEEFRQIQHHAQMSYEFLRQIPWTTNLSNVPSIARSHHERLDGSGYPQGLRLNEIPMGAKLMGIADVYDALTASDRPYKRAMSPELALRILRQEAVQGKLDMDALEVFIEREIYRVNDAQKDKESSKGIKI